MARFKSLFRKILSKASGQQKDIVNSKRVCTEWLKIRNNIAKIANAVQVTILLSELLLNIMIQT